MKLHYGDNLEIMQEMAEGSVDLIATDPPFNTGRDWGAFNDKWEGGLKGYLKFIEARCVEMRRVLKDTGSLYLHCDPTASHYLKIMLDGVFGIKQFRNEIVWRRHFGSANNAKSKFYNIHDIIFWYSKSNDYVYYIKYLPLSESSVKRYNKTDKNGRKYKMTNTGKRVTKPTKHFLDTSKGVPVDSLWTDIFLVANSRERIGYPTQKPVALYERIIKASSNEGDTVLDPFCGSGTTLDAAQNLGRDWIGIDQNPDAIEICKKRLNY